MMYYGKLETIHEKICSVELNVFYVNFSPPSKKNLISFEKLHMSCILYLLTHMYITHT